MSNLTTRLSEVYALLDGAPAGDWGFRSVPANPDVPLTIAGGVNSAKAAIAAVNFLRTFRAELEAQARDAERYRWLRDESGVSLYFHDDGELCLHDPGSISARKRLDAAIDALRGAEGAKQ